MCLAFADTIPCRAHDVPMTLRVIRISVPERATKQNRGVTVTPCPEKRNACFAHYLLRNTTQKLGVKGCVSALVWALIP